jgi:hypothetical protein
MKKMVESPVIEHATGRVTKAFGNLLQVAKVKWPWFIPLTVN